MRALHRTRPGSPLTWACVIACVCIALLSSRANATDPVTDLDCQLNGSEANLTWTNPSSSGPGSRHLAEVLGHNPIAFWRLGESSGATAIDTQGLSNGVYTNGVTLGFNGAVLDDADTAVYFDGGDPYIDVPHDDAMLLDEGTVAFWFYPHRHDRRHGLFSKDSNGLDTGGHLTIYWDRSKIRTRLQSTSSSFFVNTGDLPDNTWYHVAFSWGTNGMRLYVNGVLKDSENYSGGLGSTSGGAGNFEPIVIGANGWSTGNLNSNGVRDELDGRMDEVAMFDVALSAAEILSLADAQVPEGYDYDVMAGLMNADGYWRFEETAGTTAVDAAGPNDGTYSPSVILGANGAIPGSNAPDFDGVTSEVVADDPNTLQETEGNVSIACWFQAQSSPGTIVSLGNPGNSESQNTLFEIEYAGDRFFYRHERSSGDLIETEFLLGTTLNPGQWYHVALIKNERRRLLRLFLDGVEVGNGVFLSDEQGGEVSDLYWGNNPTGSKPLEGSLDEALIFARAIPEPYIRALASSLPGRAVRIERDGTEIDLLPGTATSFDDPGLGTGAFEYCVTYLVDGNPSTAECCTVTTLQPVANLTCTPNADSVTVSWQVTETYDEISVLRDGVTIATLGAAATSYLDAAPPSGSVTYEVVGALAGDDAPAAECTLVFSPAVTALTCTVDRDTATLDWSNSATYDSVDILRDGVLIATLPGATTQYTESGLLAGTYQFEVIGVIGSGSSVPTSCSATVIAEPTDVTCCSEGSGQVEVCWTDPVGYDAVEIYRDGTLVTTTTAPPCSFDTPGPGSYTYTLVGIVGGQASRETQCSALVLSPPTSVDCSQLTDPCFPPADVALSWTNNSAADSIQILRDGVVIATVGGSATSYTDTGLADGTYVYTVRPQAGACAAESSGCSIDVVSETPPSFTTQPSSQTVCPGTTIVFTVAANGTAPISFQWRKDGVDLAGETSASLVISPVSAPDAGSYDVVASNGCGTTASNAATLTVNTPASATVAGPTGGACDGDLVTLTASTAGTAPITIQWRKNGLDLAGETNATLTLSSVSAGDAGDYDVTVTNACGTDPSDNSYTLDVLVDAAVTADPAPQTVCEGDDATFTVGVTGTEPVTIQWRKDGADIAGATGLSYTVSGVTSSDVGVYEAVVTNDCASVTSAGATLTVRTAASISISGAALACEGDSVVYTATTSGTAPVSVQWQKDGVDLAGETGTTLTIASATTADSASYTAVASNACNTVTSNTIALDVRVPAAITTQPVSQDVCEGGGVTFAVAASGTAPLSIQWRKDGVNIAGATSSLLSLSAVTTADAGSYDAVVTNNCATVTSDAAVLTVQTPVTVSASGPASFVCEGTSVTLTATATGSAPISYQWRKDGVDIAGANASTLTFASATAADSGSYTVVAGNSCGDQTSNAVALDVRVPAAITSDPASQLVCEGDAINLAITVTGTAPVSIQWRKDGADIAGATASTYTIAASAAADSGSYDAVVSNDCATITSAAATVTVQNAASVSISGAALACEGDSVVYTATTSGTAPVSVQWQKDGVDLAGETGTTLTIASATTADSASYTAVASNACNTVTSNAIALDVRVPATITGDPSSQDVCEGDAISLSIAVAGTAPVSIQWRKDGVDIAGATASTYTIAASSAADSGSYDAVVSNDCATVTSTAAIVTVQVGASVSVTGSSGDLCSGATLSFVAATSGTAPVSVQWQKDGVDVPGATSETFEIVGATSADSGSYTAVATNACGSVTSNAALVNVLDAPAITGQPVGAEVCESSPYTLSVSATGSEPLAYQWFKDGTPISGATASSFSIAAMAAGDVGGYTVTVTNSCGSESSTAAALSFGAGPSVTSLDAPTSVCEGATATLTVTATGGVPFTYQWRLDGAPIAGATDASYTIAAMSAADVGTYDVVVTNDCGNTTSGPAPVGLDALPSIATAPADATVCDGDPVTFTVLVDGAGPFTYQWRKDGAPIAGADQDSFTIAATTPADAGSFDVLVTGLCGDATSTAAVLTVSEAPTITEQPVGGSYPQGSSVTLSVVAAGPSLSYQWYRTGVEVFGATAADYTIDPVLGTSAGAYTCVVSSPCGSVESDVAMILVTAVPAVSDLTCCTDNQDVMLTWTNNADYDEIEVFREGVSVALLSGDATTHDDLGMPASNALYQVIARVGSFSSALTECDAAVVEPVTILLCDPQTPSGVSISWLAGSSTFVELRVLRDGVEIAALPGTATGYTDPDPAAPFSHTYAVVGIAELPACDSYATATCTAQQGPGGDPIFLRGDANNDGNPDLADSIFILSYQFNDGPEPACFKAADSNDDGTVDVSDAIWLTSYFFTDGPEPPAPFPNAGVDPTPDSLPCDASFFMP